jgi:hypothetical protein
MRGILAHGCLEMPLSLPQTHSPLLVTLATRVKHKSFISNVYKKHRGGGVQSTASRARFSSARLWLHAQTPAIPFLS